MSVFQAVNSSSGIEAQLHGQPQDATTPTTPRPTSSSIPVTQHSTRGDESSPNTPTRNTFGGLPGQRPLPTSPFTRSLPIQGFDGETSKRRTLSREGSQRSIPSRESQDVEMGESDDEQDGSDAESVGGETDKPSKKKKGQRFFCTDFPPCTLSFTRSEHLARHIRKHTGERPFQCHCNRRFSRLDNLRQHAQTVHVNEEIPTDSLAATGTRFQRQVRTDRVRPPGSRSRASTVGSQSGPARGHSRNLSTSSIGSVASSINMRDDRRRPPPLIMANESSSRNPLSVDTFRSPPDSPGARELQYRGYSAQSPGGYSTPTSATFSTGPGSPRFPSGVQSPASTVSRQSGVWGARTPGRRLSVPSGTHPFQSPHNTTYPPYFSPLAGSNTSSYSRNSSVFASPTSSTFSSGRDFASRAAQDAEWKRRTWHPESRSTFNSPLANSSATHYGQVMPNRPVYGHSHQHSLGTRLPGIESFDQAPNRPTTPPRRGPSPMQLDTPSRPPLFSKHSDQSTAGPDHRRGVAEWDMSLHHNLTRLGITSNTPPTEPTSSWKSPHGGTAQRLSGSFEPVSEHTPQGRTSHAADPYGQQAQQATAPPPDTSDQSPTTPRKAKRRGWYNGPLSGGSQPAGTHRTSPEDSSSSEGVPTPSTSSVGEYNPSIVHSNGWVETDPAASVDEPHPNYAPAPASHGKAYAIPANGSSSAAVDSSAEAPKRDGDMLRLEALVAVATSEDK
ncbi:MAG: hypothetical protein M1833_002394 [Piccolia ochrophora]|nr:MAG: hypothetical protein M1833_002394 [Piccolia ochrophora]